MTLEERTAHFERRAPELLKELAQVAGRMLDASVNSHILNRGGAAGDWVQGKILGARTGNLSRSYQIGKEGNIFEVDTEGGMVQLRYGSSLPYAGIHETGGFIASQGRMHKWFWAQYYKSNKKIEFFRIMALSVKKKGGVSIPKRPAFAPGISDFIRDDLGDLQMEIALRVIQEFATL